MDNFDIIDRKICPRCFDNPENNALFLKNAVEYASLLDEDLCVPNEEYERRLLICENCENLTKGVCVKCGCFIIVRARRKNKGCPIDKFHTYIEKDEID